ncbi:carbohydrate ABC transporter permease [Fundicoccus sp. Sow4_H7]|uniref:carbohydrate ABC transporter permease n=1 Tax=Fundicoccus sp. Sow4_H7 TaxID=3438784 RepID=UPI003F8E8ABF
MQQSQLTNKQQLQQNDPSYSSKWEQYKTKYWVPVRKRLFGTNDRSGWLIQAGIYLLLLTIGFVYLYPLLFMVTTSFKSLTDLLDTSIRWIPSELFFDNYRQAISALNFKESLLGSIVISLFPTLFQVVVTALTGYAFARFDFPFKRTLFFLMIFSFIVPPQVLMMPTYVLYSDLGLLGSLNAFIIPAALGQGIKSTIFVLIYYQFFKQTPKSLYEAAEVDGASEWTNFFRIGVPMATPAIIIVFLFSFVWYWNETYLVNLYLTGGASTDSRNWITLQMSLASFRSTYERMYPASDTGTMNINEGITMAGTMLTLIPLLITYFFLQKYFTESVDNSGITGE